MKINILLLFLIVFTTTVTCAQPSKQVDGDAAFLFAYYPKEGMQAKFDEGYKKHLEWHRDNNDPLPWYGWYVLSGDRLGMFIDGTFGISFKAFDNRVKPLEDRQHFHKHVAPYGDAAYRKVFILEPDLSTVTRLEDWDPTANIEAYTISIMPGKELLFEDTIKKLTSALDDNEFDSEFTFYRQLTGGNLPSYLMMVPHSGFVHFDSESTVTTLSYLIERSLGKNEAKNLQDNLSMSIKEIYGETWLYRKDLSYFPEENN